MGESDSWLLSDLMNAVVRRTVAIYPRALRDRDGLTRVTAAEVWMFLLGKGRYAESLAKAERGKLDLQGVAAIIGAVCARRLVFDRTRAQGLGIWDVSWPDTTT